MSSETSYLGEIDSDMELSSGSYPRANRYHSSTRFSDDDPHLLPSEIVDYIVEIIAWRKVSDAFDIHEEDVPPIVFANKQELGLLSLTCRYWAKRCRPHIFKHAILHSLGELHALVDILEHAKLDDIPSVLDCLERVYVVQTGRWTVPWLHHVYAALRGCIHRYIPIYLTLDDTYILSDTNTSGGQYAPRLLSAHLPKTIPGDAYHFYSLELSNLRFRRVPDLLSLLHNITVVREVTCTNVQFGDPAMPTRRTRASERELFLATVSRCGSAEFEIDLAFAILSPKSVKRLELDADTWSDIRTIMLSVFPTTDGWRKQLAVLPIHEGVELGFEHEDGPTQTHKVVVKFEQSDGVHGARTFISSVQITLNEESALSLEQIKPWNWSLLDQALSKLDYNPNISIKVETKSVFEWLLTRVAANAMLAQTHQRYERPRGPGKLEICFAGNVSTPLSKDGMGTTVQEVINMPTEYTLGDRTVSLSLVQKFDMLFCRYPWDRQLFLLRALCLADSGVQNSESDGDISPAVDDIAQQVLQAKAVEIFGSINAFMQTCAVDSEP